MKIDPKNTRQILEGVYSWRTNRADFRAFVESTHVQIESKFFADLDWSIYHFGESRHVVLDLLKKPFVFDAGYKVRSTEGGKFSKSRPKLK